MACVGQDGIPQKYSLSSSQSDIIVSDLVAHSESRSFVNVDWPKPQVVLKDSCDLDDPGIGVPKFLRKRKIALTSVQHSMIQPSLPSLSTNYFERKPQAALSGPDLHAKVETRNRDLFESRGTLALTPINSLEQYADLPPLADEVKSQKVFVPDAPSPFIKLPSAHPSLLQSYFYEPLSTLKRKSLNGLGTANQAYSEVNQKKAQRQSVFQRQLTSPVSRPSVTSFSTNKSYPPTGSSPSKFSNPQKVQPGLTPLSPTPMLLSPDFTFTLTSSSGPSNKHASKTCKNLRPYSSFELDGLSREKLFPPRRSSIRSLQNAQHSPSLVTLPSHRLRQPSQSSINDIYSYSTLKNIARRSATSNNGPRENFVKGVGGGEYFPEMPGQPVFEFGLHSNSSLDLILDKRYVNDEYETSSKAPIPRQTNHTSTVPHKPGTIHYCHAARGAHCQASVPHRLFKSLPKLASRPSFNFHAHQAEGLAAVKAQKDEVVRKLSNVAVNLYRRRKLSHLPTRDDTFDDKVRQRNCARVENVSLQATMATSRVNYDNTTFSPITLLPYWHSLSSKEELDKLYQQFGCMEIRRQELIWELFQTEASFVESLKMVLKIFCHPLQNMAGDWVDSVPHIVGKLWNSLEEIVSLHTEILKSSEEHRQTHAQSSGLIILRVAEVFQKFVGKLTIHQAYLVRFQKASCLIKQLANNPDSEFGAFVRRQSALEECGKMTLNSFLLKPIQRLMKYPLFFKQLYDLTPISHPDHYGTLKLWKLTDNLIQIMQEVKAREDEYESLKLLERRICGLPPGFRLAVRDRKLLIQGSLRQVSMSGRPDTEVDVAEARATDLHSKKTGFSPALLRAPLAFRSAAATRPLSQLSNCSDFSYRSSKSSYGVSNCSHSSFWSTNISSFDHHIFSQSSLPGIHSSPLKDISSSLPMSSKTSPTKARAKGARTLRPSISVGRFLRKLKDSPIQVFVFSDIVVLVHKVHEMGRLINRSKVDVSEFVCSEQLGPSKVVDVSMSQKGQDSLIKLKLLSLVPDNAGGFQPSNGRPKTHFFTLPTDSYRPDDFAKEQQRWVTNLAKSSVLCGQHRKSSSHISLSNVNLSSKDEHALWKKRQQIVKSQMPVSWV
ncbi:hypothetical protein O181_004605 [Austropuccinia psidii MF-1]|uniref:DH domain-containing protein n=1 Tax=Austropuccinia psidii MF-1 TaxID=1389203 RepID=A0A9Q3GF04_9BASI|nr:hypothetical protein [Austropuccinia psidii MF-1]